MKYEVHESFDFLNDPRAKLGIWSLTQSWTVEETHRSYVEVNIIYVLQGSKGYFIGTIW